ncbi:MAG: glycyl-radical enzyme activating protein [Bacteroidales bacterium]|nr:glycyl-radical enzyme activating protein [Bacteroidales bacterium]
MEGGIFDIQHFCTGDGPGIRTTVFLKGCTLLCEWCHNPESQCFAPEILLNTQRCIGCGACDATCGKGSPKTILADAGARKATCPPGCRLCADACPTLCLEVAGRRVGTDEILEEVMQDEAYYRNSGGGMTLSGGEPMAQPPFCRELLRQATERGLHTAVETSGNGRKEDFLAAAPYVNLWLWDIKLMEPTLYRQYTGGDLDTMLDNLNAVAATGAQIRFRVLFVPEIHCTDGIAESTAALLQKYPQYSAEVIPYHLLGNAKREKLGLAEKRFREPSASETEAFARRIGIA